MRMADPVPTFSYVVRQLVKRHPLLAFIHVVEPRVHGATDVAPIAGEVCHRAAFKFAQANIVDMCIVQRFHP
jgi:hypothetical protein